MKYVPPQLQMFLFSLPLMCLRHKSKYCKQKGSPSFQKSFRLYAVMIAEENVSNGLHRVDIVPPLPHVEKYELHDAFDKCQPHLFLDEESHTQTPKLCTT